jgi:hypothetical protein
VTVGRVAPVDPLEPAATWEIALGSLAQLAVFAVGGYGWARAAGFERGASAALAPALGWAALALVAIALERLGVPIGSSLGAVLTSALAIAGGFLVLAVDERRGRSAAPREVA